MTKTSSYGIHWFRRDLRLEGNELFLSMCDQFQGRVLGVFCVDPGILGRPDFSPRRFGFLLRTLGVLRDQMRKLGGELLLLEGGPENGFRQFLRLMARESEGTGLPDSVSWNRDYEPFARARDARMEELFREEFELNATTGRDHLLIEPHELLKPGGGVYQVYSPFKKRWLGLFESEEIDARMERVRESLGRKLPKLRFSLPDAVAKKFRGDELFRSLQEKNDRIVGDFSYPEAGHAAALKALKAFQDGPFDEYDEQRDFPSLRGTSEMSVFLKNGSITVPQIIAFLELGTKAKGSALKYFQELIWREFYYHILVHFPNVENHAFHEKYRALKWENREDWFRAWCEGKTGYPIVDAGMRQMNATGWMHNRLRMIVASFLTKDLLIDWKWGERYFMEKLLDGDLALNNGGWQWAASTGCDPQPYFRVFNPVSQGEKFDPKGEFVRRWVPELRGRTEKEIHAPTENALVDHGVQRVRAIEMYRAVRK